MPEPARREDRAYQYRPGSSLLHRMPAGWKVLAVTAVSAAALGTRSLAGLAALALVLCAGYGVAGLGAAALWKDVRWLVLQGALIVALTILVAGTGAAPAGLRTALQLALVFLPAALLLRTTSTQRLLEPLRGRLPERLAFAIAATLRFVPFFTREAGELVEMQRLRGARLEARDLWRPGAWLDWLRCVAFPMTVRSVEVAQLAAEAAEMRGVGRGPTGSLLGADPRAALVLDGRPAPDLIGGRERLHDRDPETARSTDPEPGGTRT